MKCELCGGNIGIEDAFCTHCGQPNKFYKAHRADMADYEKRFSETQEEVTETAGRFTSKTVWISFIAVLVALILAEVIILLNANEINDSVIQKRNAKNAGKIAAELERRENEADYIGLADYYYKYWVRGSENPTYEYTMVSDTANCYSAIVLAMMDITSNSIEYETPYDVAQRLNRNLEAMYENVDKAPQKSSNPAYSDKHVAACLDMIDEAHKYLNVYCNIPAETTASFRELSSKERFNILEEYVTEVMENEE